MCRDKGFGNLYTVWCSHLFLIVSFTLLAKGLAGNIVCHVGITGLSPPPSQTIHSALIFFSIILKLSFIGLRTTLSSPWWDLAAQHVPRGIASGTWNEKGIKGKVRSEQGRDDKQGCMLEEWRKIGKRSDKSQSPQSTWTVNFKQIEKDVGAAQRAGSTAPFLQACTCLYPFFEVTNDRLC